MLRLRPILIRASDTSHPTGYSILQRSLRRCLCPSSPTIRTRLGRANNGGSGEFAQLCHAVGMPPLLTSLRDVACTQESAVSRQLFAVLSTVKPPDEPRAPWCAQRSDQPPRGSYIRLSDPSSSTIDATPAIVTSGGAQHSRRSIGKVHTNNDERLRGKHGGQKDREDPVELPPTRTLDTHIVANASYAGSPITHERCDASVLQCPPFCRQPSARSG